MIANRQRATLRTHSRRGIASFLIGVVWIPLFWLLAQPQYGEAMPLLMFSCWLWVVCPLGVFLGWRGLRERTHSRTYAGLGIVMNAVLFVALVTRIFL